MRTLRLTHTSEPDGEHRVTLELEGAGPRQTARTTFRFPISREDRERVRWYLEDYLEYPTPPAPQIAAQVEARLAELGIALFRSVFSTEDARDVWGSVRGAVPETRVEVVSDLRGATAIPWELLRDPKTDRPLALRAAGFVRAEHQTAQPVALPPSAAPTLRVLLVICRPGGGEDVPFRSVASHLIRLSREAREAFQLDVLRPPTFERLARVLRAAAREGRPYHVVHFDGHGTYAELPTDGALPSDVELSVGRYSVLSPPRLGSHGYLVFEDPTVADNTQLVDGPALGALLAETGVPVLVLNACRSAYAEAPTSPQPDDAATDDVHARVRGYGSLAQEVVDAGLPGVVAMRYSVWVVTAAQFLGELYGALLTGSELGAAVTEGRRQLARQPMRQIAFEPRSLQDWMVPVVYTAAPLTLFAPRPAGDRPVIHLDEAAAGRDRAGPETGLPAAPDVGFYGRDETLLALDRAFDKHRVVLLHELAGSGKTATAAEFARWYQLTGGLDDPNAGRGPVLFSSFEHHLPLLRVLDQLGEAFAPLLEANGISWLGLTEAQRRDIAEQLLARVPVLWIWDNVEPVAGFPTGSPSAWSAAEQRDLVDFLRAIPDTKARVLLTSRRDETSWLGELPARVTLPPMPMRERVQLARAIVAKHPPHQLSDVEDWRPLLRYSDGNPLTLTVLVGQALRQNLTTRAQLEAFVARLQAGGAGLDDDATQGRTRSLGASLGYGLDQAFSEPERARLAVLHLFHGFVDVDALVFMGKLKDGEVPTVPELAGLDRAAGSALLDRAAEIGLLTAHGGGYYSIHPALPWFFTGLFTAAYGPPDSPRARAVLRAYTDAISQLGNYWHSQFTEGRHQAADFLAAEEANLLHARELARRQGWWDLVIGPMQGLRALYDYTGRAVEWARLVTELEPELVDAAIDGPRSGREEQWSLFTGYRVRLARQARDWARAERLQRLLVDWDRGSAATALATRPDRLTDRHRSELRNLGVSLHELAEILREQQRPDCVDFYRQSRDVDRRFGDRHGEAVTTFNLGHAYLDVPGVRDLDQAETWYRTSLSLREESDRLGGGRCLGSLGRVALERFDEAQAGGAAEAILLDHLNVAADYHLDALALFPDEAINDRAVTHYQLGTVYRRAGMTDEALGHYQRAIRLKETAEDRYGAGESRRGAAGALASVGRFDEALLYARAALEDFQAAGPAAAPNVEAIRQLIEGIERDLAEPRSRR